MGYESSGARTAEEGLRLMSESLRQIVLLDLNLPVMSGMECLDKIHQQWPLTSVIIMTGFGDLESAQKAIRLGVIDFLTKPCHLGDIERALGMARRKHLDPDQRPTPKIIQDQDPPIIAEVNEPMDPDEPATLEALQKRAILRAYERHNGNRTKISEELGITRRTLYNHLVRYGIQGKD